ncbi:hypothetical protein AND_002032 [Anopheles darlingi]|uniref:Uncharacterized protein n=1 Tax=Anopheles darlingi TaxID=43151 RepID=W5JTW0_ANODA|nr:hypothetical protein AND_002032 [Anopheles darlingi]
MKTMFNIPSIIFHLTALCMVIACVSFPFGWNSDEFRKVCGPESNRFEVGLCSMRWAYPLAIIACIDGFILATLSFILATRHVRLQPEPQYQSREINNAYVTDAVSIAGSRKSLNLQPVLLVAPPHMAHHMNGNDTLSSRAASRYGHGMRPDYHSSLHQFQL